jgi:hypothetical protein
MPVEGPTITGGSGGGGGAGFEGVTVPEAVESIPVPFSLVAATVKLYTVPTTPLKAYVVEVLFVTIGAPTLGVIV